MKKLIFSILLLFPSMIFSQGVADPLTKLDLTRQVKNILPVANGGTGTSTIPGILSSILPGCTSALNGINCVSGTIVGNNFIGNSIMLSGNSSIAGKLLFGNVTVGPQSTPTTWSFDLTSPTTTATSILSQYSGCLQVTSGVISGTGTGCGSGGGSGSLTSFSAPAISWPTWLTPTVTNSTSTPSLTVSASTIPSSILPGSGVTTINGASCTIGSSCTPTPNTISGSIAQSQVTGLSTTFSNYLLLSGGTLTGTLSGTNATFTGLSSLTGNVGIGVSASTSYSLLVGGAGTSYLTSSTGIGTTPNSSYILSVNGTSLITGTELINGSLCVGCSVAATYPFTVNGISEFNSAIYMGTVTSKLVWGTVPGTDAYITSDSSNNLYLGNSNINVLTVTSAQTVGIGTSSPAAMLEVTGTSIFDSALSANDGATITGLLSVSGSIMNSNGTLLPSTATTYVGKTTGGPLLCASGGTSTQFCGGDGNWHTPTATLSHALTIIDGASASTSFNGSAAITLNYISSTETTSQSIASSLVPSVGASTILGSLSNPWNYVYSIYGVFSGGFTTGAATMTSLTISGPASEYRTTLTGGTLTPGQCQSGTTSLTGTTSLSTFTTGLYDPTSPSGNYYLQPFAFNQNGTVYYSVCNVSSATQTVVSTTYINIRVIN